MRTFMIAGLLTVPFLAASCETSPEVNAEASGVEAPNAPSVTMNITGMT